MRLALLILAFLLSLFSYRHAFGKEISIEWKETPLAARYELQIKNERGVVFDQSFSSKDFSWRGNLPAGSYTYRLRTYDSKGRAGSWSDPLAFSVALPPPTPITPAAGTTVILESSGAIFFKWNPGGETKKFLLIVNGPAKQVRLGVAGTQAEVPNFSSGEYSWQVEPVGETGTPAKASPLIRFRVEASRKLASESPRAIVAAVPGAAPLMFSINGGLLFGADYILPAISLQKGIGRVGALGLQGSFSSDEPAANASVSVLGALFTYTSFLYAERFSGPFMEVGLGPYFFGAANGASSESFKLSLAGKASAGWQLRLFDSGLSVSASIGMQYIDTPKITLASPRLRGLLPLFSILVGYSF